MIAVVSYGVGNVKSIANMLHRAGLDAVIATAPHDIRRANRIILPGVGSFDAAVALLNKSGLRKTLDTEVAAGKPILGICLGMQLLGRSSEEGKLAGLGWVEAETRQLSVDSHLPLPHMGWNFVQPRDSNSLFRGEDDPRYYFLHSYAVACDDASAVTATCVYGETEFACAIETGNVAGVQFHPEKSHRFGMRLLTRFAADG